MTHPLKLLQHPSADSRLAPGRQREAAPFFTLACSCGWQSEPVYKELGREEQEALAEFMVHTCLPLSCCPLPPGCLRCAGTGWLDYWAAGNRIYWRCPACLN